LAPPFFTFAIQQIEERASGKRASLFADGNTNSFGISDDAARFEIVKAG
jgi:hypothetical protein